MSQERIKYFWYLMKPFGCGKNAYLFKILQLNEGNN